MENNNTAFQSLENCQDLLTISDLGLILRVGRNTTYNLISTGQIDHIRVGRQIRIPKQYLVDYIARKCDNRPRNGGQICADAVKLRR